MVLVLVAHFVSCLHHIRCLRLQNKYCVVFVWGIFPLSVRSYYCPEGSHVSFAALLRLGSAVSVLNLIPLSSNLSLRISAKSYWHALTLLAVDALALLALDALALDPLVLLALDALALDSLVVLALDALALDALALDTIALDELACLYGVSVLALAFVSARVFVPSRAFVSANAFVAFLILASTLASFFDSGAFISWLVQITALYPDPPSDLPRQGSLSNYLPGLGEHLD